MKNNNDFWPLYMLTIFLSVLAVAAFAVYYKKDMLDLTVTPPPLPTTGPCTYGHGIHNHVCGEDVQAMCLKVVAELWKEAPEPKPSLEQVKRVTFDCMVKTGQAI